jgi:hypothetical protein
MIAAPTPVAATQDLFMIFMSVHTATSPVTVQMESHTRGFHIYHSFLALLPLQAISQWQQRCNIRTATTNICQVQRQMFLTVETISHFADRTLSYEVNIWTRSILLMAMMSPLASRWMGLHHSNNKKILHGHSSFSTTICHQRYGFT